MKKSLIMVALMAILVTSNSTMIGSDLNISKAIGNLPKLLVQGAAAKASLEAVKKEITEWRKIKDDPQVSDRAKYKQALALTQKVVIFEKAAITALQVFSKTAVDLNADPEKISKPLLEKVDPLLKTCEGITDKMQRLAATLSSQVPAEAPAVGSAAAQDDPFA
jgi:hypothetical protein